MSEGKTIRLASAAKELNVGIATIVDHLHAKGFKDIEGKPNHKLTEEQYEILMRDFKQSIAIKEKAEQINIGKRKEEQEEEPEIFRQKVEVEKPKVVGKIDIEKPKTAKEKEEKKEKEKVEKVEAATPVKEKKKTKKET